MNKSKDIKAKSPAAAMSNRERSNIDKRRTKKFKSMGNTANKYSAFVKKERLTIFGRTKEELLHKVQVMADKKGFTLAEVEFN